LGGTDIRPQDSFSYRSNFRFRSSFRSRSRFRSGSNFRSRFSFRFSYRSSSSYTTSGDIFYCSGSRQLNHSSCELCSHRRRQRDKTVSSRRRRVLGITPQKMVS